MSSKKQNLKDRKSKRNTKPSSLTVNLDNSDCDLFHLPSIKDMKNKEVKREPELICIDDEEEKLQQYQPCKKIKQEFIIEREYEKEPLFNGQKLTFKDCLSKIDINGDLKVLNLNHFFKHEGQIYFEVMVGTALNEMLRTPQIVSFSSLTENEETKLMVYHYIASACKSISIQEHVLDDQNI